LIENKFTFMTNFTALIKRGIKLNNWTMEFMIIIIRINV